MVCLGRGERVERGKAPYGDGGDGGGDVVAPPGERVLSGLLDQQQHAQRGGAFVDLGELGLARQVDRLLLHLHGGMRSGVSGASGTRVGMCGRVSGARSPRRVALRTFFRAIAMAFTA